MQYKNMKVKVRSPDGDTDYFNIIASVLQGDVLAPYLFIICPDYELRTSTDLKKENGFKRAKKEAEDTPHKLLGTQTTPITALIENTPTQAESLLHSLEQAAGGIGLHINADKTEYICFHQRRRLHTNGWSSETSGQVHLPQKQRLINREWHQHQSSKGMDSYR